MQEPWAEPLAGLLTDLSRVQDELLQLLAEKHALLARSDAGGMAALETREQAIVARLQWCHDRRGTLLQQAAEAGRPSESLRALAGSLPPQSQAELAPRLKQTAGQSRLLQHQSLTNWLLTQRTLLHLSQMLEIIATGGRKRPTYGKGAVPAAGGSLVDRAV